LQNGELLDAAKAAGLDVFVTTDRTIRYQRNLTGRRITVVALGKRSVTAHRDQASRVADAIATAMPGSFVEVEIPVE